MNSVKRKSLKGSDTGDEESTGGSIVTAQKTKLRKRKRRKTSNESLREWFTKMDQVHQGALKIIEKYTTDGKGTRDVDAPVVGAKPRRIRTSSKSTDVPNSGAGTDTKQS